MPRDPYGPRTKRTPVTQPAVVVPAPPPPPEGDETEARCPTCCGKGSITVVEAAALEDEAKRRDKCICQ